MKKIILTIVFFFVSVFSAEFENPKSVIRPGTELCFDSDYLTFQFGKACSNDFINCIKDTTDGIPPFMGLAYYSTLDTNFVVFVNFAWKCITIFRTYTGLHLDSNNKKLKNILKDEFLNMQSWNTISLTKDSAETLVDKIIYSMLGGECSWQNMEDSIYTEAMGDITTPTHYYGKECDIESCCAEYPDGGASMIDNWWTLLPDEKPTSVFKKRIKNRFRLSSMNHETFFVEGINEATPYKIFDVNGILLKQGLVQNGVVQVPRTPSILDIAHQKFLLK